MDASGPSLKRWAGDRSGWSLLRDRLAARRVNGDNPLLYVGGLLVFLLILQVASGVLLMLHYQPSPTEAHASVAYVIGGVPYGALVRAVHLWSGDLLILLVVLQLFSVVIRRTFRSPNELLWVSGLIGLLILLALAFTGVVLPWSESAYLQARVGSEIVGQTPFVGRTLRYLLRGGDEVTTATLRHAYGFHVAVLPAALTLLLGLHMAFLRRLSHRPVAPETEIHQRRVPIYPDFLVRMGAAMAGMLAVVISLATFVERPLGPAAEVGKMAVAEAQPPWFFLFVHDLLMAAPRELLGVPSAKFIVGASVLVLLLAFFVPFFDRRGSRLTAVLAGLLLVVTTTLSIHAAL